MKCRHCGMESRNTQVCEWCRKPMAAGPSDLPSPVFPPPVGVPLAPSPLSAPSLLNPTSSPAAPPLAVPLDLTQPISPPTRDGIALPLDQTQLIATPPLPTRVQRVSLTGDLIETSLAAEPTLLSQPPPGGYHVPGATGPLPAGYAAVQSGLPLGAVTAGMVRDQLRTERYTIPWSERFELFLAIAMPVLLGSVFLVHSAPAWLPGISILVTCLLSLALGATGSIPSFDDSYTDVAIMLVVTFLLGPILALVVHVIVGLIKQEWNGAILGLLGLNLITYYVLLLALLSSSAFSPAAFFTLGLATSMIYGLIQTVNIFLSFGAWMFSGIFRPLDAE